MRNVLLGALLCGVLVGGAPQSVEAGQPADCADYGNLVSGVHEGNLVVTQHGDICTITGTVTGNVSVFDATVAADFTACDALTAINVIGGTVEGNVKAAGGACAMVWLRDGAVIDGNVIYRAGGNLGFLGNAAGALVKGNVVLHDGRLWATGSSATNHVAGNLICNGGQPVGAGSGSATNWDGLDGDVDGTVAGRYLGC